jgi:hypothetical protein
MQFNSTAEETIYRYKPLVACMGARPEQGAGKADSANAGMAFAAEDMATSQNVIEKREGEGISRGRISGRVGK